MPTLMCTKPKGSCKTCQFYRLDEDNGRYACFEAEERTYDNIVPGMDAVFLPGKIHGAEHRAIIIYANECANEGNGSFEIEVVDAERILKLYDRVDGDAEKFFEFLPDDFQGEWGYVDNKPASKESFDEYVNEYFNADFILGRDGGLEDEMNMLVRWAKKVVESL